MKAKLFAKTETGLLGDGFVLDEAQARLVLSPAIKADAVLMLWRLPFKELLEPFKGDITIDVREEKVTVTDGDITSTFDGSQNGVTYGEGERMPEDIRWVADYRSQVEFSRAETTHQVAATFAQALRLWTDINGLVIGLADSYISDGKHLLTMPAVPLHLEKPVMLASAGQAQQFLTILQKFQPVRWAWKLVKQRPWDRPEDNGYPAKSYVEVAVELSDGTVVVSWLDATDSVSPAPEAVGELLDTGPEAKFVQRKVLTVARATDFLALIKKLVPKRQAEWKLQFAQGQLLALSGRKTRTCKFLAASEVSVDFWQKGNDQTAVFASSLRKCLEVFPTGKSVDIYGLWRKGKDELPFAMILRSPQAQGWTAVTTLATPFPKEI